MQKNWQESLSSDTASKVQPSEMLISAIAEMFVYWKRCFRNKIKDEDWGVDVVFDWAEILTELRVTKAEFETAKNAVRLAGGWPPNHPADFLELARAGKQSEYLDTQTAFETACRCAGMRGDVERDWRHPTVLETANRIGWGVLAQATNGFIKYFEQVYSGVIAEHQSGAEFTIPEARRIEAPKKTKLDDDSPVAQEWEKLKARMLGKRRETT
ncbi:hypothetical protein [Psychrobacter sanguinis]|uniref:hypothetical protein n=2 Tax=Psychrobacter sanguinis TaxID=861445 RepID=UPI001D139AED|nr:hypothetical protein [Psychrobacter sanguinis]MCC3344886.1 hypothetical protein [Psychrobacter sanguinis]